ncbi:MAG: zinc ribbon domain-containing protein [Candidatus Bathyarchaeota archaeon]|nr:zinc ribbon domain-containing protein [Candidatus Bathyarchaeum sp.]
MNCPHCGSELESEDVTFCPNCGESLTAEDKTQQEVVETPLKQTDLKLAAAIFTMISATFVASLGYLGVYQYFALIDYYGPSIASDVVGFLIFGVDGLIAAAFALAGAFFILKKKLFIFSMIGTIFPLASVFVTFLCIQQYNYGFTDILIFAEVATAMLSVMSILLNFVSKKEYT